MTPSVKPVLRERLVERCRLSALPEPAAVVLNLKPDHVLYDDIGKDASMKKIGLFRLRRGRGQTNSVFRHR